MGIESMIGMNRTHLSNITQQEVLVVTMKGLDEVSHDTLEAAGHSW